MKNDIRNGKQVRGCMVESLCMKY